MVHMDFNRYDNPNIPPEVKEEQALDRLCHGCRHYLGSHCPTAGHCKHPLLCKWSPVAGFDSIYASDGRLNPLCGPTGRLWEKDEVPDWLHQHWPTMAFWGFVFIMWLAWMLTH